MAFRPNYGQQRGDRLRAKEQKKQEKLQRREEGAARRRAERGDTEHTDGGEASPEIPSETSNGPQETTN